MVVGGDALVAFFEAVEEGAEVNIEVCGAAQAGADGGEGFGWEGRVEDGHGGRDEFFGDGDGGLFAPNGELGRDGQEHDDQLLLREDGVAHEGVGEACEAASAAFEEGGVRCEVVAVNWGAVRGCGGGAERAYLLDAWGEEEGSGGRGIACEDSQEA